MVLVFLLLTLNTFHFEQANLGEESRPENASIRYHVLKLIYDLVGLKKLFASNYEVTVAIKRTSNMIRR